MGQQRPKRLYRQGIALLHTHRAGGDAESALDDTGVAERARLGGVEPRGHRGAGDPADPSTADQVRDSDQGTSNTTFYITNSERRLKLVAKSERQLDQFITSMGKMSAKSEWARINRFDSFAPVRSLCSAKWLVDGRDYFFALSRAISMAKTTIYIHDWQLSPEIYLRRPPKDNESWRLDRLLKRKAESGVKIYIILYKEGTLFLYLDSLNPVRREPNTPHRRCSVKRIYASRFTA